MVMHFKNIEAFRKYNAYRYTHGKAKHGHQKVLIAGKLHHVQHVGRKCYVYRLRKKMTIRKKRR